jgi:N-acetylneuraminic acid mutarotase
MRVPALHPLAAALLVAALLISPTSAQAPLVPGTWQTMAPLPDLRSEISVATDGTRIFMLGGFARTIFGLGVSPFAVYAFDPAVNGWSHLTDLPEGVNHAGLAYLDGMLYVVGGYRRTSLNPLGRVMIYDLASDTWSEGPGMLTPRGAMGVVMLDGRIHAIGGTLADNVATAVHEVLDVRTGVWTRAADMPTPRDHVGVVATRGEIIVMGGRNPATFELTANEIWSPRTNSWRAAAPVPTGRSGVAAAVLDGFVYLFGGEAQGANLRSFDTTERYDPATDRWVTLPPMPTPRHGHGAATVGGFIYVISGGIRPGWSFSNVNERLYPH